MVAIAAMLAGVVALWALGGASATGSATRVDQRISERAFQDDMRKLWEDHVTWTRLFIVSAAADLPDLDVTAERLLQNQADIGDAVSPFYGDAAGDQLEALLREHILIAADVLAAAKSGDQPSLEQALDDWYRNGKQIARFLHDANPDNWPLHHMRAMMREHLDLTLEEATQRLQGDFAADVAAYEKVHVAILEMADMLTDGIVKQFPKRFSR
jgi:hypothetical protein